MSIPQCKNHISGHQDQPCMMPVIWVIPWSGPGHAVGIAFGISLHLTVLSLFQSTQHGQKHISGHWDKTSIMPGSWVKI